MSNGKNRLVKVNTAVNGFLNLSFDWTSFSLIRFFFLFCNAIGQCSLSGPTYCRRTVNNFLHNTLIDSHLWFIFLHNRPIVHDVTAPVTMDLEDKLATMHNITSVNKASFEKLYNNFVLKWLVFALCVVVVPEQILLGSIWRTL
jgi:hypothetical protein